MKVRCKNCLPKGGIGIPGFNQSEKQKLLELTLKSAVQSTKYIIDNLSFSHGDAKYIVTPINTVYGYCNCCIYDKLTKEYIKRSKCGALNFN